MTTAPRPRHERRLNCHQRILKPGIERQRHLASSNRSWRAAIVFAHLAAVPASRKMLRHRSTPDGSRARPGLFVGLRAPANIVDGDGSRLHPSRTNILESLSTGVESELDVKAGEMAEQAGGLSPLKILLYAIGVPLAGLLMWSLLGQFETERVRSLTERARADNARNCWLSGDA